MPSDRKPSLILPVAVTRTSGGIIVILLSLALIADLGAVVGVGALTADAYYMPLRSIPAEPQDQVEAEISRTHSALIAHQRGLWLAVHSVALLAAIVLTISAWRFPSE